MSDNVLARVETLLRDLPKWKGKNLKPSPTEREKAIKDHAARIISPFMQYAHLEKLNMVGDKASAVNKELEPLAVLFEKIAKTLRSGSLTPPAVSSILHAWQNGVVGFSIEQDDLEPEIELGKMAEKFEKLSKDIITRRRRGRQVNQPQRNIGKAAAYAWLKITGAKPVKHVMGSRKTDFTEFLDGILITLNLGGSGEAIADAILPLPETKQSILETYK